MKFLLKYLGLLKIVVLLSNDESYLQTIFLSKNIVYLLSSFLSQHVLYTPFIAIAKTMDFKLLNTSSSDILSSQFHVCSLVSFGKGIFSLLIYFTLICNFILVNNDRMYLTLDCTIIFKVLHILSSCWFTDFIIYVINIVFMFFEMLEFCF